MFLFIFFLFTPCQCAGKGENVHEKRKKKWMQIHRLLHVSNAFAAILCGATTWSKQREIDYRRGGGEMLDFTEHRTGNCACVARTLSNVVPKALLYCFQRCLALASCGTREGSEVVAVASQLYKSSNLSRACTDWPTWVALLTKMYSQWGAFLCS
uniref:Putative secreted protein n=1 Tax=Amblyomma triste TaxID=251400 RepID=A0A023G1A3_AMBTT